MHDDGNTGEARVILELSLPEDHWRIATAKNYEGQALAGTGDFENAEPILLESLPGLERAPIPDLAEKGRTGMAEFYAAWGKPDEARKYED